MTARWRATWSCCTEPMVIAQARTDHPNYLETAGHRRGFMTFRWVGERNTKPPLPKVTKLPIAKALAYAQAATAKAAKAAKR